MVFVRVITIDFIEIKWNLLDQYDMANYEPAYDKMIRNEGGYTKHTVSGDRGGQTYAGIARNYWPSWPGWADIDRGDIDAAKVNVSAFYDANFWQPIHGNDITSQAVAETIFDFAVNAGVKTAVKLAQIAVGATPDGVLGPKTLNELNAIDPDMFVRDYALAKVARYVEICKRDRSQSKFLLG
ncbi:MAG TPA: hypothetical protein DCZ13_11965, partial [Porticoccaceae bacterium]|nr:hypothetical protein [Porticoccaceae bacterium]